MLARELQMGDQVTTVMMWVSPHTVTCRPLLAHSVMNGTCSIEGIAISPVSASLWPPGLACTHSKNKAVHLDALVNEESHHSGAED